MRRSLSYAHAVRASVLDDVRLEDPARAAPPLAVESARAVQTVHRGPGHRERVMGVVVGEQALAAQAHGPVRPSSHESMRSS